MLSRLANSLLRKAGKTHRADERIPNSYFIWEVRTRLISLIRGIIRFRTAVFVEAGVRVRSKNLIRIGKFSTIHRSVFIDGCGEHGTIIGKRVKIGAFSILGVTNHISHLGEGIQIGDDSGIGEYSFIGAGGGVEIGKNVIMGQYVSFHASNHLFHGTTKPIREQGSIRRGIVISDNVWVGAKVTFLDGTHVGSGCVVAAGAVVSGEFPRRSLIGGVPARIIRMLDEEQS